MDRRSVLKMLVASSLMAYTPALFAKDKQLTIYGPIVLPTLLLGVAAQQGQSPQILPWSVDVWRDADVLRAGLANRTIEASIVPSYVAANLAARGESVKLLNIMTKGLLQVVGRDGILTDFSELIGKKIVLPFKNDMPDLVMQALCKIRGIKFTDLDVLYAATPPEALALFLHKKVDLALLPEPLASVGIMRGKLNGQTIERVFDMQKAWEQASHTHTGIPQAGLLVSTAFYEANREFLGQLHEDLQAALTWSLSHLAEAAKIGSQLIPVPTMAIETSLPHSNLVVTPSKAIEDDLMTFFSAMYELNPQIVGGKLPDSSLFA